MNKDKNYLQVKKQLIDKLYIRKTTPIVIFGPPGCGKTYLIKECINELGLILVHLDYPPFNTKYLNQFEVGYYDTDIAIVLENNLVVETRMYFYKESICMKKYINFYDNSLKIPQLINNRKTILDSNKTESCSKTESYSQGMVEDSSKSIEESIIESTCSNDNLTTNKTLIDSGRLNNTLVESITKVNLESQNTIENRYAVLSKLFYQNISINHPKLLSYIHNSYLDFMGIEDICTVIEELSELFSNVNKNEECVVIEAVKRAKKRRRGFYVFKTSKYFDSQ